MLPVTPTSSDATPAVSKACGAAGTGSLLLRWLIPLAILVTALAAITGNRADTDLWGHVTYGRELLRDGELPRTTTWSYATTTTRWINHENLSEIALAWTYDTFGTKGLLYGKLLLATIIVCGMAFTSWQVGARWGAIAVAVVAAADAMEFHWHFRPQAFSYLFFTIEIVLLNWVFQNWQGAWRGGRDFRRGTPVDVPRAATARLPWLCLLPVLFIVWTNTHGGFAAGVAIFTAYLGVRAFEAWAWWGRGGAMVMLRIGMFAAMGLLATFVNPYGPELHAWMWKAIGVPQPEIVDWRPIDLFGDPDAISLWILLAIGGISLTFSKRRKDFTQMVILAITLWQAMSHVRHLVFFAILCGCWLPAYLEDVLQRMTADFKARLAAAAASTRPRRMAATALTIWTVIAAVVLSQRLGDIPVRRDWYPTDAMQFVANRGLSGRFLVDFNWAQYAIMCFADNAAGGPESRVAIDGRYTTCYSRQLLDVYLDFMLGDSPLHMASRSPHSPGYDPQRALDVGPPDLVLVSRERPTSIKVLEAHRKDWVLLYQDGLAQLWGRRAKYDHPRSYDYVPESQRVISDVRPTGSLPWPGLPQQAVASREPFVRR